MRVSWGAKRERERERREERGIRTVQITLGSDRQAPPRVLGQRVQHVVQEPDPRADRDLLRGRELRRVRRLRRRHDAALRGLGGLGVFWRREVRAFLVGWEHAAVEGQRDLDLGLVRDAGDGGGAAGEGGGHGES